MSGAAATLGTLQVASCFGPERGYGKNLPYKFILLQFEQKYPRTHSVIGHCERTHDIYYCFVLIDLLDDRVREKIFSEQEFVLYECRRGHASHIICRDNDLVYIRIDLLSGWTAETLRELLLQQIWRNSFEGRI